MGGFTMTGSDAPGKVIVVPDRLSTFKDLYGLALVGRTVDLETLVDFNKLMKVAKVEYSRLQYIGGLSILISFSDEVSASGFLESRDLWRPWFSKLEVWSGQSLPLERVAWLNLHGTPLHLVDAEVFMQVGELFGKVLHVPNILEGDKDLSYFRVGVLAGEANRIGEVVTIKWKNMRFRVLVEEDQEIWVPDCIDNDNGGSLVDDSPLQSSPVCQPETSVVKEVEETQQMEESEGNEESHNHVGASPYVDSTMHGGAHPPNYKRCFCGSPKESAGVPVMSGGGGGQVG
ncbi:hypothetical protein HanPSC8_Chr01g0023711 [Helianthus annuus]|nr:hypothetical protein HanPSC8_Chr01g0023711 [Helianthus annuus]